MFDISGVAFVDLDELLAKKLTNAFLKADQNEPLGQFLNYIELEKLSIRKNIVAVCEGQPLGYVTILWGSKFTQFQDNNIPELRDLNVIPKYRSKGLGRLLIKKAEQCVAKKYGHVGLFSQSSEENQFIPEFYNKMGYRKITKIAFPYKCDLQYEGVPKYESMLVDLFIKKLEVSNEH